MIQVDVIRSNDGNMVGFRVSGHAGFDVQGSDIVCASVSVLVINCINSLETFSDTDFTVAEEDEASGTITVLFKSELDDKANLLIASMMLGLKGIQDEYGKKYVTLHENC